MGTGAMMFAFRNSTRLLTMNPFILLGASIATMMGTHMLDYNTNFAAKNLMYGCFIGTMSASLLPMVHLYASSVLFDAAIATGVTMGALSTVAYNAPSEQFLNWGGPLACGLGGLLGVSLLSMLYPGSPALTSIWLYGGLALFSAFVLYDVQHVMHRAKTQHVYDPISGSIGIYMDAINIFVRFAMILGNSKKK
jgi:growth hormone-inducible transmembrane protein